MMYKLILVASAVNAAEVEPEVQHTAALAQTFCNMLDIMPELISSTAEHTLQKYVPGGVKISPGDLKGTEMMVQTACKSWKNGESVQEAFQDQIAVLKNEVGPGLAGKAAAKSTAYFMGADSAVTKGAENLVTLLSTSGLDDNIKRAYEFVKFINKVDSDKNTHMSFADIGLPTGEAARLQKLAKDLEGKLQKAIKANPPVTEFQCGGELYGQLQELVKQSVYDEVVDRTEKLVSAENALVEAGRRVALRVGVSKLVKFTDCNKGGETPSTDSRLLLA